MGTDIHLEVERLGDDGVWHLVEHPTRKCDDEYCTDGAYNDKVPNKKMVGEKHYHCNGTGEHTGQFWNDRHYDVFAMLADVRNGYGFAGIDTGDGFVPVAPPRGLPDDLGPEIVAGLKRHGQDPHGEYVGDVDQDALEAGGFYDDPQRVDLGEHSFSWLTVAELLAYDWEGQVTTHRGWVDPWQFEVWRRDGKPQTWSGGISGGGIEHISNAAMARMIDSGDLEWDGDEPDPGDIFGHRAYTTSFTRSMQEMRLPEGTVGDAIANPRGATHYTQVEWDEPYVDSARGFLRVLHRDLVPLGPPDEVRIVFGFDS